MGEWKETLLSDLAFLRQDSWKVGSGKLPYVGLEHIEENRLRLNEVGSSDNISSNKYRFSQENFLFGKLRPYFRKVVRPGFNGICSTDIWVVGSRKQTDLNFLFYLFATNNFVNLSYSGSSGTRMPRADWNFMKDTTWYVPIDIEEQKAIASVLSSLDDKIDLLHRQNKTLEGMAETLFRQWFVEEAQENWEEKKLSDIAEHKKINEKPQQNQETLYWHYSIVAFDATKTPVQELGCDIKSNKYKVLPNSVLISKLNPKFPRVWAICSPIQNNSICSTEFQVVLPKNPEYFNFIYYFLKSKTVTDELIASASGTSGSHQRVAPEYIFNLSLLFPPQEKIDEFNKIVDAYLEKMTNNHYQIQTLEKLRDTLLPKLMSGQVRVEYEN